MHLWEVWLHLLCELHTRHSSRLNKPKFPTSPHMAAQKFVQNPLPVKNDRIRSPPVLKFTSWRTPARHVSKHLPCLKVCSLTEQSTLHTPEEFKQQQGEVLTKPLWKFPLLNTSTDKTENCWKPSSFFSRHSMVRASSWVSAAFSVEITPLVHTKYL